MLRPVFQSIVACALVLLLGACSASTQLQGATPGMTLAIKGIEGTNLPRSEDLASKATGQYLFMARDTNGDSLYGILPLRVSGGKMAGSILFFAPALFIGGFRDVFPYYEFDTQKKIIRYKSKAHEEWRVYTPSNAEGERAKAWFDTQPSASQ